MTTESTEAQLMRLANNLSMKEGSQRTAERLIGTAALVLLLGGVKPAQLNSKLAAAIREYDEDDTGDRH
jgi:hypothetical protein